MLRANVVHNCEPLRTMGDAMNYTIEIRAWSDNISDGHGPALVATIDASDGSPHIADVHYRRGSYDAWKDLDLQSIASLIVTGNDDFAEDEPAAPVVEVRSATIAPPKRRTSRPGDVADTLTSALRERILNGEYAVGTLIPTRAELLRTGQATSKYQHKLAIRTLQDEGLIGDYGRGYGFTVLDFRTPAKGSRAVRHLNPKEHVRPADSTVLAVYAKAGNFTDTARKLGVSWNTARSWVTTAQRREEFRNRPVLVGAAA